MRRHLLHSLLVAALAAQSDDRARPDPVALVNAADKMLQKHAPDEDALLLLWQAEDVLRSEPEGTGRAAVTMALQGLLQKADANANARQQTHADAAKKVLEIAALYRGRRWFDLAADRVRVAARFDPEAAAKETQLLQTARGPAKAAASPPAPRVETKAPPLLTTLHANQSDGDWKFVDGELQAPASIPKDKGVYWIADREAKDCELQCDLWLPAEMSNASLLFGSLRGDETFLATCYLVGDNQLVLRIEHCHGTTAETLGSVNGPRAEKGAGWQHLAVRVRGQHVGLEINGTVRLEHDLPREAHGRIGFFAIGSGAAESPRFRNLAIGPLPEREPGVEQVHGELQAARQKGVLAQIARGEELLKAKKTEAALIDLRAAAREVRDLDAGVVRDGLEASVEKLLLANDPVHARRHKTAVEIGALFAVLADRYAKAGFLRGALEVANEAAAFDPAGQAATVTRITEALAARDLEQAKARAKELEAPPADNALLQERFANAQLLQRSWQPWVVDGAGARVLALADSQITALVPPGKPAPGGRYATFVHLPQPPSAVGYCFDAHGDNDFGVAILLRREGFLTLAVHRYYLGKWQLLGVQQVPCEAWRTAGWFELQFEDTETGVRLACSGIELKVERSKLGAFGRVGLYAENDGSTAAGIELRGLRLLP